MKWFKLLIICCAAVLINVQCTNGILKRVKRTDMEKVIPKASGDFAKIISRSSTTHHGNNGDKDKEENEEESDKRSKDMDQMYDQVIENFNVTKERAKVRNNIKGHKTTPEKDNKKHSDAVGGIAAYVLRGQDHASKDASHIDSPEKNIKQIIMIDTATKDDERNLRTNEQSRNAANLVAPSNKFAVSHSSPFEQMFRLANMFFYNLARDTVPMHTQSASLTVMPLNNVAQAEMMSGEPEAFDYFYNTAEPPSLAHRSAIFMPASSTGPTASVPDSSHAVFYGPSLVFKQPLSVNEPKHVLNVIENALDTIMAGSSHNDDSDDEIELHCPIHHEKKNAITNGDKSGRSDKNDDGIIHVCSCRLIKKKKRKNAKKHTDLRHADIKSLVRTAYI